MDSIEQIVRGLNPRQREAVECLEGPLLIMAGAGSGKTKVLVSRIANLLAHGVPPTGFWPSPLPIRRRLK